MPLPFIGPVVVNGQHDSPKHAVAIRLSEATMRAIKQATLAPGASSPLQVELSGNRPGITIAGEFFPISLAPERLLELYSRTRHHNPTKPIHHRPPFNYEAQIHAKATVTRPPTGNEDTLTGKAHDRSNQQKRKTVQVLPEVPTNNKASTPGGTPAPVATTKKRKLPGSTTPGAASSLGKQAVTNANGIGGAGPAAAKPQQPKPVNPSPLNPSHPPTPATSKSSVPASSISNPTLQSRVVHSLALKPMTAKELAALLNVDTNNELSEVLRRVAETPRAGTEISNTHWSPGYSAGAKAPGIWKLKPESYQELDVFRWSSYEPADRKRIVKDIRAAFDILGLAEDAPERRKLRKEEKMWNASQAAPKTDAAAPAASTKRPPPIPPPARKKVKMKNLPDPVSSGGNVLSSKAFRGGQLDDGAPTKKSSDKSAKPKGTTAGTKKDKKSTEADDANSLAATAIPLKKKKASPPPITSVPPPQAPPTLAPPAQIHSRRPSHTPPPPPVPKSANTLPPKPSPSPRPAITGSAPKRKRDEADDALEELGVFVPPSRPASTKSSLDDINSVLSDAASAPSKKRKIADAKPTGRLATGLGSEKPDKPEGPIVHKRVQSISSSTPSAPVSTASNPNGKLGQSPGLNNKPRPKTTTSTPVPPSPPPPLTSHSRTSSTSKTAHSSSLPPAPKKPMPVAPPPAQSKGRNELRKQMADYTDSSEEEEDESEAAPPPKVASAKPIPKAKSPPTGLNGVKSSKLPTTQVQKVKDRTKVKERSNSPAPSEVKRKPQPPPPAPPLNNGTLSSLPPRRQRGPLPTTLEELQERWYEDYGEYARLYALVQLENQKLQKALKQVQLNGDASDPADMELDTGDVEMLQELRSRYDEMHKDMMDMKRAMAVAAGASSTTDGTSD